VSGVVGLEAKDAAASCNVNIQKEKYKYENQNERQGGHCHTKPQPNSRSRPEGQERRQSGVAHSSASAARPEAVIEARNSKAGSSPGFCFSIGAELVRWQAVALP